MSNPTLPALPIRPLRDVCDAYLKSVKPHLSPVEYAQTTLCVRELIKAGGEGEKLHEMLEQRKRERGNWLEEWWLKYAYLGYRPSVMINSNPNNTFGLLPGTLQDEHVQLRTAARFIARLLHFKRLVDTDRLPTDHLDQRTPLCMAQYKRILGTCRIPRPGVDELVTFGPAATQLIIVRDGLFYVLDVHHPDGSPYSTSELFASLKKLDAIKPTPYPKLGALTTQNRDVWAAQYAHLAASPVNLQSLDVIARGVAVLCLDRGAPTTWDECANLTMHGNGSSLDSCNRWLDKSYSVIVSSNGRVGTNIEHSPADGGPLVALADYIVVSEPVLFDEPVAPSLPPPRQLHWQVDDEIVRAVEEAKRGIDDVVARVDLKTFEYTHHAKPFIKRHKISPDAYFQMAMQLAYYRMYGRVPATYETAQTRVFANGRTETIRVCTSASLDFVQAMESPFATAAIRAEKLRVASHAHTEYSRQAMWGHGVDRQMMGYRLLALESGRAPASIFTDPAYARSSTWTVSSSQLPIQVPSFLCFGPVVEDGYGVCYSINRDAVMSYAVSCWREGSERTSTRMGHAIAHALTSMHDMLEAAHTQAKL